MGVRSHGLILTDLRASVKERLCKSPLPAALAALCARKDPLNAAASCQSALSGTHKRLDYLAVGLTSLRGSWSGVDARDDLSVELR